MEANAKCVICKESIIPPDFPVIPLSRDRYASDSLHLCGVPQTRRASRSRVASSNAVLGYYQQAAGPTRSGSAV
jgi:hypothetical protein